MQRQSTEETLALADTGESTKVTMNLSNVSLKDVEIIRNMSGSSTTRTSAVANALRAYRMLLEMQKEGKLILEKGNTKERIKFIS
jgi:hypothetical protein